jgi:hypothetical protein
MNDRIVQIVLSTPEGEALADISVVIHADPKKLPTINIKATGHKKIHAQIDLFGCGNPEKVTVVERESK